MDTIFWYYITLVNGVLLPDTLLCHQSLLYEDPTRWSLTFQTHVQQTKLENHVKESNARVKLMERSVFSGFYCFVENLHQSQLMQPAEYAVLSEWFKWITRHIDVSVDLIGIYLLQN